MPTVCFSLVWAGMPMAFPISWEDIMADTAESERRSMTIESVVDDAVRRFLLRFGSGDRRLVAERKGECLLPP